MRAIQRGHVGARMFRALDKAKLERAEIEYFVITYPEYRDLCESEYAHHLGTMTFRMSATVAPEMETLTKRSFRVRRRYQGEYGTMATVIERDSFRGIPVYVLDEKFKRAEVR